MLLLHQVPFSLHHRTLYRTRNMFLLDIWLLSSLTLLGEQVSSQSINDVVRSSVILRSRDDCGKNSSWQVTKENWKNLEAGKNIALWWEEDVSADPHQSFAIELGRDFGSHLNAFECGIGALSTCIAPGCSGKLRKKHQLKKSVVALDYLH